MAGIFNEKTTDKISRPDQLDKMITITSPMSWLMLIGVALIVVITLVWSIFGTLPTTQTVNGIIVPKDNVGIIFAEQHGTVIKIEKKAGDVVAVNDVIATIKLSDGTEQIIKAQEKGKLNSILVEENTPVYPGAEIARFTPEIEGENIVVCYIPVSSAQQMKAGMKVLLYPTSVDTQKNGHMEATVVDIGDYAVSTSNMWYILGADNLMADIFLSEGPVVQMTCKIKTSSDSKNGFYWTNENGNNLTVSKGTLVSAKVITDESAPISKLFNNLKEKFGG